MSNRQRSRKFTTLTRGDLLAFDSESTALILEAMSAGCVGRVSSKGHCILHNSTGNTASVSRNLKSLGRSAQNTRAAMKRFLEEQYAATGGAE